MSQNITSCIMLRGPGFCYISTQLVLCMSTWIQSHTNNLNLKLYNKNMKYSLFSMATLSTVSKYGFSSSSTSSVLTLMASIAALSESENRKRTSKCTSFRQSFHCGCCYLPLGALGSGRLAPILSICLWGCDDLFSSQHCWCPGLPWQICFRSKISHNSMSCFVSVYICAILLLCPPPVFLPLLSGLYIHVCLRNKLLPPSLLTHLCSSSQSLSPPPALIQAYTNALQILSLMKASQWTGHL